MDTIWVLFCLTVVWLICELSWLVADAWAQGFKAQMEFRRMLFDSGTYLANQVGVADDTTP